MFRKKGFLVFLVLTTMSLAGCATGRNYQADIDALNSKISALQGQLDAKDQEVSRLQDQVNSGERRLSDSENEKRQLEMKLENELAKARKPKAVAEPDSDLK